VPPTHVVLPEHLREAMVTAARAALPREWVAVLGGIVAHDSVRVQAVAPLADADTDRDHFAVEAAPFAAAEAQLRAAGHAFVGFAHSHPGGSAAPSHRDVEHGWRGCVQLVLGLAADTAPSVGAFVLAAGAAAPLHLATCPTGGGTP
jgi:proteasome lid subunit RPN8/RPN11